MYTENENGTITFSYSIDELFKQTSLSILYMADQHKNKYKQESTEELGMSNDDFSFFKKLLRDAFDNLFSAVSVYAKYVTDPAPYRFNVDLTDPQDQLETNNMVAITLKMPDTWGVHMMGVLDNHMADTLEKYVTAFWFKHKLMMELYALARQEAIEEEKKARSALFYRNTPAKKKYKYF